jgi:SAM-dependent methyltransferase
MNPDFLPLLCCPETGESLRLEGQERDARGSVLTGNLRSAGGRTYPIVRGVPRFVDSEQYTGSFGYEWSRWPRVQFEAENAGRAMAGHTQRMWERSTGVEDAEVRGKTIVEFGCGPGRFLDVVRRKGGLAVGLELSRAVEVARDNFAQDPQVLVVQGDVLKPPFRKQAFDGGYSLGVLHHTPAPLQGLRGLADCIRPGGWLSVCVYPRGEFYDFRSVARFRRWVQRLQPSHGVRPALWYSYFAGYALTPAFRVLRRLPGLRQLIRYLERNWLVHLDLPDVRWRVLDIFDAITPAIASTHTGTEVEAWLAAAGCEGIQPTPWCKTSFRATRAA